MKKFFRYHGLTLVLLTMFVVTIGGQFVTGFHAYNEERIEKGQQPLSSLLDYAVTGHFISSVGENLESEFLQMAIFVWFTAFLYQRGSAESHPLPEDETEEDKKKERVEQEYCRERRKKYPVIWRLYENSMVLTLGFLFVFSFAIHMYGSFLQINEEKSLANQSAIGLIGVLSESKFWFESFQNWESEFLSIAVIVFLSVYLRQKGSSQSKRMNSGHYDTD